MSATLELKHPVSIEYVRGIFSHLASGDGKKFFEHVADDVDWTVEGTHPLAGHYRSKAEFRRMAFDSTIAIVGSAGLRAGR